MTKESSSSQCQAEHLTSNTLLASQEEGPFKSVTCFSETRNEGAPREKRWTQGACMKNLKF